MKLIVIPTLEGFLIDVKDATPPIEIFFQDSQLVYKGTNPVFLHRYDKAYNTVDVYYKVKDANGEEVRAVPGVVQLDRYEVGFLREILKREELILKKKGGFSAKVFKRKRQNMEEPCPNCRTGLDKYVPIGDGVGSEITNCEYCYGVGLKGGYYPPITVYVNFFSSQEVRADLLEPIRISNYLFYTLNYPLLEKEDLIWVEALGKMFRVTQVQVHTYKGIPIKQMLYASEIEQGHPAYKLSRQYTVVITEQSIFTAMDTSSTA